MAKKKDESYQEYRDRVLNPLSPTFCGAKFYNATIWLGSGTTASCHHPPAHKIPLEEVKRSIKAIHNTEYKKAVREQMLRGEKPDECEYCWKIEGLGPDKVSDRVFKSVIYTDEELLEARDVLGSTADINPKTLEIAFDANCNFACSYCNPSFSTTWMKDVRVNGPYQNLISDGGGAFQQDGSWAMPYGPKNENNPYVDAFMKWWETDLQHSLTELRVTGGEATMSPDFWKLLDWWKEHPDCNVRLAVNTNLGAKQDLIEKLCEATHSFKEFHLYTSNESFGKHAEYIRDGLDWNQWSRNMRMMLEKGNCKKIHVMLTINSLCLLSITDFMDEMLKLRAEFGSFACMMSFNILRFPSFQAAVTLPEEMRNDFADKLTNWLNQQTLMHPWEIDGLKRLISYLREVSEGHSQTSSIESRMRDFKSFYAQYDQRRGKNFRETFPELVEWYDSIPDTNVQPIKFFKSGDVTEGWDHVQKLKDRANKEGWILNPSNANPGAQGYQKPKAGTD
jgi:hypothetical protein